MLLLPSMARPNTGSKMSISTKDNDVPGQQSKWCSMSSIVDVDVIAYATVQQCYMERLGIMLFKPSRTAVCPRAC